MKLKRRIAITSVTITVVITSFVVSDNQKNKIETNIPKIQYSELEKVQLERVVDGDTIVIITEDKKTHNIRLIGIDTPESVHPNKSKNNEYGILASDYTKGILSDTEYLYLEYDEEKTDHYGRVLAYVWMNDDENREIQNDMLNGILLQEGFGINKEYKPNIIYAEEFQEIAEEAEDNKVGLWKYEEIKELW